MRRYRHRIVSLLFLSSAFFVTTASAQMVQQMNLADLTDNADKIFRGKVLDMTLGTVEAGGGVMPTITYRLQVSQTVKGIDDGARYDSPIVELRMFGSIKERPADGNVQYLGGFKPELLDVGGEYLLFTTQPSSIGLSTMVGLGQGKFEIVMRDKQEMVVNGLNNQGLFRGIDRGAFPAAGPINYEALVERIRAELTN